MSTPSDLRSRVTEYQTQLAQIIALLLVTPGNEQLVKLKSDLEKAIALTNQLIAQQQGGPVAAVVASSYSTSTDPHSAGEGGEHSNNESDASIDCDEGEEEEEEGGDEGGHGTSSGRGMAPGAVPPTPAEVPLRVGENVEAVGGNRPYAGTVLALSRSTSDDNTSTTPDTATVKYFEFEAPVMVSIGMLQRIPRTSIKAGQLVSGFKCQAKFGQDQQWYDAIIESASEHGYMVTFIGYGNTEEVPIEYIRSFGFGKSAEERKADMRRANATLGRSVGDADGGATKGGNGASGGGSGSISTSAGAGTSASSGVRIPASLRILPTDTEEEKLRKKKRIKSIKSKERLASKEAEVAAVQQSWQKFVQKGTSGSGKRALPGLSALKAPSMFSSPDTVDGRVGVVNSGHHMTDYGDRKRHKFDALGQK